MFVNLVLKCRRLVLNIASRGKLISSLWGMMIREIILPPTRVLTLCRHDAPKVYKEDRPGSYPS